VVASWVLVDRQGHEHALVTSLVSFTPSRLDQRHYHRFPVSGKEGSMGSRGAETLVGRYNSETLPVSLSMNQRGTNPALQSWSHARSTASFGQHQRRSNSYAGPVLLDRDYYSLDEILAAETRFRCVFLERVRGMACLDTSGGASFAAQAEVNAASLVHAHTETSGEGISQENERSSVSDRAEPVQDFERRLSRDALSKDRSDIMTAAAAAAAALTHQAALQASGYGVTRASASGANPSSEQPLQRQEVAGGLDMLPDMACDLPLWLAEMLAARMFVRIELPPSLRSRTLRELRADPCIANLNEKCPYFYAVVQRFRQYFRIRNVASRNGLRGGNAVLAELGSVLLDAHQARCLEIADRAQSPFDGDPLEQLHRFESSERAMFFAVQGAAQQYMRWKRGELRRLRPSKPLVPYCPRRDARLQVHPSHAAPQQANRLVSDHAQHLRRIALSARNLDQEAEFNLYGQRSNHELAVDHPQRAMPMNVESNSSALNENVTDADKENTHGVAPETIHSGKSLTCDTEPQVPENEEAARSEANSDCQALLEPSQASEMPSKRMRRMLRAGESTAAQNLERQTHFPSGL